MARRRPFAFMGVGALVAIAVALWLALSSSERETIEEQPTVATPKEPAPTPMLKPKAPPAVQQES